MEELATREIMWNIGTLPNVVTMYSLMVLALIIGGAGLLRQSELVRSGKPSPAHEGDLKGRILDSVRDVIFQRRTIRSFTPGVAHTLVYVGFLALLFATTVVFIEHDLGIPIYRGNFYLFVTFLADMLGIGVLFGVMIFAHRRYIAKADLVHSRGVDAMLLIVLALLIVQGFVVEGLRIHHGEISGNPDRWAAFSPIGLLVSKLFWGLSIEATKTVHYLNWWFHTITVFAAIAIAPYSKFLHIIASSVNLFFNRTKKPPGALPFPGDIEKMVEAGEEFSVGLGTIKDYSWKQLLDLEACTSCGRCQDACPAYRSGKPLSPKWMILDTRNHAMILNNEGKLGSSKLKGPLFSLDQNLAKNLLLKGSGIVPQKEGGYEYADGGVFRGKNELVQKSALKLGANADQRISGEVIDSETFWSCTTCMACVEACPVGINHVDQIVENRRNMVLMQGEVPTEAQKTLKALENRGNPYGPPEARTEWIGELKVPVVKAGDEVEYLYWVGCVSAFDKRKQKIARSLVTIMNQAGLSYGILGNAEGCSGDPARRLGEENLFQTLAKGNIETLKSVKFKYLVANCPHCFNTIKNEYPQLGNLGDGREPEIIHHSVLLKTLLAEGKIALKDEGTARKVTMHDPCYLGRYNGEFDAPRETIKKSSKRLQVIEMDESREKAMCCGAGGGHFWMDLKIGTRVNAIRTEHAAATGADTVATGCPFCLQMMEDGVKITGREEKMEVRDIAELVAENLR
jgi:Fe-S oxidoreductase/nitrate reductase gamma subunit